MKPSLLAFLASGGILFTACDRKPDPAASSPAPQPAPKPAPEVMPPPAIPEPKTPAGPSARELDLEKQIRDLQVRQEAQQEMLDAQKLAQLEAEVAHERALLEKDRQAWMLEQQLKEAKSTPPVPEPPRYTSGSRSTGKSYVEPAAYAPGYDYNHFYDDLSPYGSWFETSSYGYVWRPSCSVSNTSWRPYTSGRWAWCDAGWSWVSDEPFGWACYHYGRWAQVNGCGWVWVPGDTWAPAWVSWRRSSDHIGWCPLPPETLYDRDCTYGSSIDVDYGIHPRSYVYVPCTQFDRPVLANCLAPQICVNLFRVTSNCTNFVVSTSSVQCFGPKRDWVMSCVGRDIPVLRLDCRGERPHGGFAGYRDAVRDGLIECYAPRVSAPWNHGLRPGHMEAKLDKVEVLRADKGLSKKVQERFAAIRRDREQQAEKVMNSETGKKVFERQGRVTTLASRIEELREARERTAAGTAGTVAAEKPAPPSSEVPAGRPDAPRRDWTTGGKPGATPPVSQPGTAATAAELEAAKTREELIARQTALEKLRTERETKLNAEQAAAREQNDRTRTMADRVAAAREKAAQQEREKTAEEARAAADAQKQADAQRTAAEQSKNEQARTMAERVAAAREEKAKLEEQRRTAQDTAQQEAANRAAAEQTKNEQARTMAERVAAAREEKARLEQARRAAQDTAQQEAANRAAAEQTKNEQARTMAERVAAAREEKARLEQARRAAQDTAQQEAANRAAVEQTKNEQARTMAERVAAAREEKARLDQERRAVQEAQNRAAEQQQNAARERAAMDQARAREEAAARQEQAQQEARREAMERARAEQESRQREAARAEQQRQQAEQERTRQEQMERARAENEARQREAQERARQEQMERARAENEARQREAQERARQQQEAAERARQEQAAREAAERARWEAAAKEAMDKKGK